MPPKTITFAIPFYSNTDYLLTAIESVRNQTYPDWSIVVCDDCGPNPEAEERVEALRDPRIRYIRYSENLGLGGNWNRCLREAKGDLINILHADDRLFPHYAQTMIDAHTEWPDAVGTWCQSEIINSKGETVFSFPDYYKTWLAPMKEPYVLRGEQALEALFRGNFIMCPTLCFKVAKLGGRRFSQRWTFVLDLDFVTRLLLDGETLVGLPSVALSYRRHSEMQTVKLTDNLRRFREELSFYVQHYHMALQRQSWQVAKVTARRRILRLHYLYRILEDVFRGEFGRLKEKIKFAPQMLLEPIEALPAPAAEVFAEPAEERRAA